MFICVCKCPLFDRSLPYILGHGLSLVPSLLMGPVYLVCQFWGPVSTTQAVGLWEGHRTYLALWLCVGSEEVRTAGVLYL